MAITVDVFAKDTSISHLAISGVIVNVYDASTLALLASATTNSGGDAAFLLPGTTSPGINYEVRLFKSGVLFSNPVSIAVLEPLTAGLTNVFDVQGTLLTLPIATDPRCCRCTGYFRDFGNRPVNNAMLRILARADFGLQTPKIVDGNLVSAEAANFHSDSNGKFSFDLLRGGRYYLNYGGEDDIVWSIAVPDRPSVNLIDLVHPAPVLFAWDPGVAPSNAVSVQVGHVIAVPFTLTFSDFEIVSAGVTKWVSLTNSDNTKIDLAFGDSNSTGSFASITGIQAGSASVTVTLQPNLLPVRVPDYSITAPPLLVTVTP